MNESPIGGRLIAPLLPVGELVLGDLINFVTFH